ncbi:HMG-Y-related protein A [Solanum lycopersicum]|uniref:H15 domain-containing protein n=1 Tax=Solanum lycopersicum TaxID=4081 RepID=A0A3Q7GNX5_SOLLC|nr:HMG-Y-related protein A [Solanum lycopersicum]
MATEEHNLTLPSYPDMIMEAIDALNEEEGSNKSAIWKQIEATHGTLPPAHGTLLAHHLNQMKQAGQLVMLKNNYMKPNPNAPPRRGRGRPPKPKSSVPVPDGYPRPRGRPPKERDPYAPITVPMKKTSEGSSGGSGKKRGRPRKYPMTEDTPVVKPIGAPRGRGRPPKVKTPVAATVGA